MDWVKTRSTLLAFCGIAFAIYWMATAEVRPVESEVLEANLSPRSKMLEQLRRQAQGLSVRELLGLKRTALSKSTPESERRTAIYTIGLSPKAVSRSFLREIAQKATPEPIRATAQQTLRQLDKKFQEY